MKPFSPARRQAVLASAAAVASLGWPPRLAQAAAAFATRQPEAYYHTWVGDYQVTVLLDGVLQLPADNLLKGGEASPLTIRAWLAARARAVPTPTSVNTYLINTGRELLLVDAGGGDLLGDVAGSLARTLHAAGYQAAQVDRILLTHIHADHVGGLARAGQAAFPNAQLWAAQTELDYWLGEANLRNAPQGQRRGFEVARAALGPYLAQGRVKAFQWGDALAPGIQAVDLHGHTPGHTGFDIRRGGAHLRIWGDIVHVQDIQFDRPEIAIEFDVDADAARAQRRAALADAARQGYRVAGSHLAFPGIGHVRSKGEGYEWLPDAWATLPESGA